MQVTNDPLTFWVQDELGHYAFGVKLEWLNGLGSHIFVLTNTYRLFCATATATSVLWPVSNKVAINYGKNVASIFTCNE